MKKYFDIMFKIEPYRNQDLLTLDVNLEEKKNKSRKSKKGGDKKEEENEEDEKAKEEEEERLKKEKKEEINQILRLGHEKLVISCLGIGYTNITKTLI
jgi:hypothetical protein